jgi:hypothetical protein
MWAGVPLRQWHGVWWLGEDEQEDAAEDEAVVSEEGSSDEEADSAGPGPQ